MAESKISLSICRIRKQLPRDQGRVTIGSGCIVSLKLRGESKTSVLITTTQVITKDDLLSASASNSVVIEFLDRGNGKLVTFNLGFKLATDIPDSLSGRSLEGTGEALKEVSFIIIPVQKFDDRNVFKKVYSSLRGTSFEKRSLPSSHPSDEDLQIDILTRRILCHVICDGRSNGLYSTEPYRLQFGTDNNGFVLGSPLDHDGEDDVKQLKDFHKEEKPKGAPLLNSEGSFVGMLAIAASEQRKLLPLFLPTLDKAISTRSKDEMVTNVITVAPEPSLTVAGGFDQAMGNATRGEEVRNEIPSSNNNQHLTHNPLQLQLHHSSSDPDPDQLCAGGNTFPPQHPHLLPVSVGNRRLNGQSPDDSSPEKNPVLPSYLQLSSVSENISLDKPAPDELSPGENPLPPQDPRLAASIGNNNVSEPAPDKLSPGENPLPAQDLHLGSLAENNTLIDPGPDELSPVENPVPPQDLQLTTHAGNNSLVEPAPDELSLEENPLPPHGLQLVTLPGSNNVNEPAALDEIHPAENVVPPLVEQDVMAEQGLGIISSLGHVDVENLDEQMDSLSAVPELNENVHQPQNADQPVRPNLLTQNSCYDQPNEFRDENDTPYGVNETAASPKHRITPPSIEQTEDLRRMLEGQLSTAGAATSTISSLVTEPITHHNTSSGEPLKHFKPDSPVKDEIVSKVKIMDMLSLHLDRSVCPGRREVLLTQRWEHLADEFKVPDEIKRQCENFTGKLQSPSECMFEHLCMTNDSLSIEALKVQLLELKRKDVADELDNNSSLSADEATVTDLCNDHPETLNAVCLKLDDIRGPINWYSLGMRLGISGGTLWKFKDPSGHSPSEVILQKIATLRPNLSITTIAAALEKEVPTAAKVLNELSAGSTIKTLLGNLDVLDKVTALLDLQESSWMHFGSKFNIDRLDLDNLKPDPVWSPTKVLMEFLVKNDPNVTMATFLESLEKIKRYDVIKGLTRFFCPKDVYSIVRDSESQNVNGLQI